MTSLNAERYIRSLPCSKDKETMARLSAVADRLFGGCEGALRGVFHIVLTGLHADSTAAMLDAVLGEAGIKHLNVAFNEPYRQNHERSVLYNGKQLPPDELACAVSDIRNTVKDAGILNIGRYETLVALAIYECQKTASAVLITDASALPAELYHILPPAKSIVLDTLCADGEKRHSLRALITRSVKETVSVPQTPTIQNLVTSQCVEAGCRLTLSVRSGMLGGPVAASTTFAGISFNYRTVSGRISSIFHSALACAASVYDEINVLRRSGYKIDDTAVSQGIAKTRLPHHGNTVSIDPALISAAIADSSADSELICNALLSDIVSAARLIGKKLSLFALTKGNDSTDICKKLKSKLTENDFTVDIIDKVTNAGTSSSTLVIGTRQQIDDALPTLCSELEPPQNTARRSRKNKNDKV